MATLAGVRGALETTLTDAGIRKAGLGDQVHPPCFQVSWNRLSYSRTMSDGLTDWDMRVRVYVSLASNRAAVTALDDYCDPTTSGSIKNLLEADGTQGGVVDDTFVSECSDPRVYDLGNSQYLGVEFTVLVIAA